MASPAKKRKISKTEFYKLLHRDLNKYNIRMSLHRISPVFLFNKSKTFRKNQYEIKTVDEIFSWFGYHNTMSWREILNENEEALEHVRNENPQWLGGMKIIQ